MDTQKEQKIGETHPDSQSPKVSKKTATIAPKKKLFIFLSISAILFIIIGTLLVLRFVPVVQKISVHNAKKSVAGKLLPDNLRGRRTVVDPAKDTLIQVYADNKMVVLLEIPKNTINKKQTVTLIPFKDSQNNLQVQISPSTVSFKSPVSLTFDLSRTKLRTSAPKIVTATLRQTGNSQVLLVDKTSQIPMLIARGAETNTRIISRILTGGTYKLSLNGKQIDSAKAAFSIKNVRSTTILEAGTVLVFNNQKLNGDQKSRIKTVTDKIIGLTNPSPFELLPALLLQKKLVAKNPFVVQAYAADMNAQYLEFRCKDKTLTVEEYVVEAQTAQLIGHDDIGQKCLDAAKAKVADEARSVLGNPNATTSEIIRMMAKTQMFGLDELDSALQTKLNNSVNNKVQDVLKDPNASLNDVLKALQDAQVTGQTGQEDALNQKISDVATKEIDAVLNNPNSTSIDIALATQKAQALGLDTKATQGIDKLKQMANRSSEEILNNQNSTSQELQNALAQAVTEGKDQAYKDQIRQRIKDAQQKEAQPTPAPTNSPSDPSDLQLGVDSGIVGMAFLQMIGVNSFDEQSLKNFVQEKTDQSNELIQMMPGVCEELRQNGMSTPDTEKQCQYFEGGQASSDVQKAHDDAFTASEHVGDIQNSDYQAPDPDPHIEIDITPTPEPNETNVDNNSNNQDGPTPSDDLMNSSDTSNQDNSGQNSGTSSDQNVQGVRTTNYLNVLLESVGKFLQPAKK